MNKDENQEHALAGLAEEHNANLRQLAELCGNIQDAYAAVRERYRDAVGAAVTAESESRAALHNAVAESDASLWERAKTRIVGYVKYGKRKERGKVIVEDEAKTLARLREAEKRGDITTAELAAVVVIKASVKKEALRKLPASVLARAGVQLEADCDKVVTDNVGDAMAVIKHLRADGWMDAKDAQ